MISPWLDPSRKPPNALRGLRRKMAHFIPSAGVHTKGSYNSTTAFCAPSKKKRRWAPGRLVAEPRGSRFSGAQATAALELLRLAATIGGTALRRSPANYFLQQSTSGYLRAVTLARNSSQRRTEAFGWHHSRCRFCQWPMLTDVCDLNGCSDYAACTRYPPDAQQGRLFERLRKHSVTLGRSSVHHPSRPLAISR